MKKRVGRYSKADFLKEISKVFKILDRPFSRREYDEVANIHSRLVEKRFGSWNKALEEAGLAEKFKDFSDVEKEIKNFKPEDKIKEDWDQEREKLVKQAEGKKIKWLKGHLYKMELLQDMLNDSLSRAIPPVVEVHPISLPKVDKKTKKHCTLWVEFSDLQLGSFFTSEEMGGINQHNWLIWQEKIRIWKEAVIEKINSYLETNMVDQVVISILGDLVDGMNIFKGHAWQVDRTVVDQAIDGANDTAAAFIEIFLSFPQLQFFVCEVFGNHGRLGNKKGEFPYSCSMDKVFLRFTELQIKSVPQIKNCTWYQNEAWFYLVEIYGFNHLLLHGDQGMSGLWSNRPTINGLEKGTVRYCQMLKQNISFLHIGHFHQEASLSFNMSQILINGSFIGTSPFSATQMTASSPPVQVMHIFEPDIGLTKTERIYLESNIRCPIESNKLGIKK